MDVKRQRYKDKKTGKSKKSMKHTIFIVDHKGVERAIPGFRDKAASLELGRQIERLAALRAANMPPDRAMTIWLHTLPHKIQSKLVAYDILDPERAAIAKPLAAHVEDFRRDLVARGDTGEYCDKKATRVLKVFEDCGFNYYHNIRSEAVQHCISEITKSNGELIGPRTMNFYTQAVQQFCSWMVRKKRATESPVRDLGMRNAEVDIRRERRELGKVEFERLLVVTADGPTHHGMTGPDRALLYLFAAETGLRASEIRSLTRSSFDFDSEPSTVTVAARYAKNRRRDVQPLRPEMADLMKARLANCLPKAPVFIMPHDNHRVPMLREDEEAAGIEYRDANGRYADFHCLRHTFITNLTKSGVHPKVTQTLARHSTITLTMKYYTHLGMEEQTTALEKLPSFRPTASRKRASKTGTTDNGEDADDGSDLPSDLPETDGKREKSGDLRRLSEVCAEGNGSGVTGNADKQLSPREGEEGWRRRADSNRRMRVLQTLALPLGYAARGPRRIHGIARRSRRT